MDYHLDLYNLELIYQSRNEVYRGTLKADPTKTVIFKYDSDYIGLESSLLQHLQGKVANISTLLHYEAGEITSPSSKMFKQLHVFAEIQGTILIGPRSKEIMKDCITSSNNICITDIPIDRRRQLIIDLIQIIIECHKHGVIYGDGFCNNVIITKDWTPYLIDFGNGFFKDNAPKFLDHSAPESMDIFCLLELMKCALSIEFPSEWKHLKAKDVLALL